MQKRQEVGGVEMKELVETLAKALVDDVEEVKVTSREENDVLILELHVASPDMGKIIGKQGRIARAIRTVVRAAAVRKDKKVIVDIVQ